MFLVAAGTKLYRAYLPDGTWALQEELTIPEVFARDAYVILIAEQGGAIAAYRWVQLLVLQL